MHRLSTPLRVPYGFWDLGWWNGALDCIPVGEDEVQIMWTLSRKGRVGRKSLRITVRRGILVAIHEHYRYQWLTSDRPGYVLNFIQDKAERGRVRHEGSWQAKLFEETV